MTNKCKKCKGTGEPYDEQKALDRAGKEIAAAIDKEALLHAGRIHEGGGYELSTHEKQAAWARGRNYPLENANLVRVVKEHERIHNLFQIGPVQRAEIEAFVEAIIQESITVMEANDYHGTWLGDKLKEHWGIRNGKD